MHRFRVTGAKPSTSLVLAAVDSVDTAFYLAKYCTAVSHNAPGFWLPRGMRGELKVLGRTSDLAGQCGPFTDHVLFFTSL